MKSVMQHQFSRVPKAEIERSSFDRSHGLKTAFDAGYLIPIYVDEALPGDTHHLNLSALARLATPKLPVMDNMRMDFFFFSVPLRLVWDNFQRFMGQQDNPDDNIDYIVPTVNIGTNYLNGLADYFGIPLGDSQTANAFHFRAYNLIWNEWFRDQNLQDSVVVNKDDGPDSYDDYPLLKRGKRHDYFTSCLPWPQKGASVNLPLGTSAPVEWQLSNEGAIIKRSDNGSIIGNNAFVLGAYPGTDNMTAHAYREVTIAADPYYMYTDGGTTPPLNYPDVSIDPNGSLYADLTQATAATINSLREAFQLQRLLERDARGGTRYTELLKAHFGVTSPDARLQRPEYLGGGSIPINITQVPQTSGTSGQPTPQGHLAGYGQATGSGIGFTASFTEHTVLLGLVSVRADLTYQQGMDRMWFRKTKYDYYWPALAHLGEQAVLNKEIYLDPTDGGNPDGSLPFGYQERYAEYRYKPSKITGILRSNAPASLEVWHLSQYFAGQPVLNAEFIEENPPIDRILAVPSEPHFIYDSYINLRSVRPMPMFGVPGLMDHF